MLGQAVRETLRLDHRVWAMGKEHLDITDFQAVYVLLQAIQPQVVINCAGMVKDRRVPAAEFVRVNSLAPHILAQMCDLWRARLIHISTDCVFSGRQGPYSEDSIPDPLDLYGRSKLAGEVGAPHLTIRTSFIGLGERGLLAWLKRQKGASVPGYAEAIWSGLTAPALARVIGKLIADDTAAGVLHVAGQAISKRDLLKLLVEAFRLPVKVENAPTPTLYKADRRLVTVRKVKVEVPALRAMVEELATPAPRPKAEVPDE